MSELIDRHEAISRDLTQKLQKSEARREKLAAERSTLGFSIHVEGDKLSRTKLDQLNMEAASLEGELLSLGGALEVAKQNLASAQAAENRAADETKAKELLVLADEFDEQVRKLQECADAFVAALNMLDQLHAKMSMLGAQRPTHQQRDVVTSRAIVTMLMNGKINQQCGTAHLAPSERKKFSDLLQYGETIRVDANARLGEKREAA